MFPSGAAGQRHASCRRRTGEVMRALLDALQERRCEMVKFIVGAIAGGLVMWFWGGRLGQYAADGTRAARAGAADTLRAVEATADSAIDSARERIHTGLQAGQDVVRPR